MPTRVNEGRRAISEEARPNAREEASPSYRPTTTRSLPQLICDIRVIRGSFISWPQETQKVTKSIFHVSSSLSG
jgi:hypothetical protein